MREGTFIPKLYQMLSTVMELLGADKGNVQFLDKKVGTLRIYAHIGFGDDFLEHFKDVKSGETPCGAALERKERVVVEDINSHPHFVHLAPVMKKFGYSSVQCSPLFDEYEEAFGVISTHFIRPSRFDQGKLAQLDSYLLQAAPVIGRTWREFNSL